MPLIVRHSLTYGLDIHNRRLTLDLFQLDQLAFASPGAGAFDFFPGLRAFQVRIPEGPGTTLLRTHGINRAAARPTVEKLAVSVVTLGQRRLLPFAPSKPQLHLGFRQSDVFRDLLNLFVGHPDDTWIARAAIAATRALKREPILVPHWFRHDLALCTIARL